jgi:hypothetical protein
MNSLRKIVGPSNLLAAVSLLFGACAHVPPIRSANTAEEQWYGLRGPGQRAIATRFYNLGTGDALQKQYWALRDIGGIPGPVRVNQPASAKGDGLQHGYQNVWVGPSTDADGVNKEGHWQAIETVYFFSPGRHRK